AGRDGNEGAVTEDFHGDRRQEYFGRSGRRRNDRREKWRDPGRRASCVILPWQGKSAGVQGLRAHSRSTEYRQCQILRFEKQSPEVEGRARRNRECGSGGSR